MISYFQRIKNIVSQKKQQLKQLQDIISLQSPILFRKKQLTMASSEISIEIQQTQERRLNESLSFFGKEEKIPKISTKQIRIYDSYDLGVNRKRTIHRVNNTSMESQKKTRDKGRKRESSNDQLSKTANQIETLDKYFGMNFKPIALDNTAEMEGSQPPRDEIDQYMEVDIKDFEINETDEDMYSESNTQSNFHDKKYPYIEPYTQTNVNTRSQIDETINFNNESEIIDQDYKIKRKIMDKYLRKPKSKIVNSVKLPEAKLHIELSKISNDQNIVLPSAYVQREESQNSQKNIDKSPQSQKSKNGLVSSLTGFNNKTGKQSTTNYDDIKIVENHIAFRNSFYGQTYKNSLETNKILETKARMSHKNTNYKLEEYMNNQKKSYLPLNLVKPKELQSKAVSKIRKELKERSFELKNIRMQTPTLKFKSEFNGKESLNK